MPKKQNGTRRAPWLVGNIGGQHHRDKVAINPHKQQNSILHRSLMFILPDKTSPNLTIAPEFESGESPEELLCIIVGTQTVLLPPVSEVHV